MESGFCNILAKRPVLDRAAKKFRHAQGCIRKFRYATQKICKFSNLIMKHFPANFFQRKYASHVRSIQACTGILNWHFRHTLRESLFHVITTTLD